jgi:hypothetical protein
MLHRINSKKDANQKFLQKKEFNRVMIGEKSEKFKKRFSSDEV